jgi:hypothetical protein
MLTTEIHFGMKCVRKLAYNKEILTEKYFSTPIGAVVAQLV